MQALIITQTIMMVLLVMVIIFLIRQRRVAKFEKRFSYFTLNSNTDSEISISDSFTSDTMSLLRNISNKLAKIPLYKKWSNNFAKYPILSKNAKLNPADFLTLKFILAIYFIIFLVLVDLFRGLDITIVHYFLFFILVFCLPNIFLLLFNHLRNNILKRDVTRIIGMFANEIEKNDNLLDIIGAIKNEIQGPMVDELSILAFDLGNGLTLDEAFYLMYERTHINKLYEIATYLKAITKTTGDKKKAFSYLNERLIADETSKEENRIYYYLARLIAVFFIIIPPIGFILYRIFFLDNFKFLTNNFLGIMSLIMFWLIYILYLLILRFIMDGERL